LKDLTAFAGGRRLVVTLALMLAGAAIEGLSLALLVPFLAVITGEGGGALQSVAQSMFARLGATTPIAQLAIVIVTFTVLITARAGLLMKRDLSTISLQVEYVNHRRLQLLEALAKASWAQVAHLRHARITSALANDIGRISVAAATLLHIATSAVQIAIQLALTMVVSWQVGLISVAVIGCGSAMAAARLRGASLHGEKIGRDGLALVHTAAQLLGGLKQAVAEDRQPVFVREFAETSHALAARQITYQGKVAQFRLAVAVGLAIVCGAILFIGAMIESDRAALLASLVILSRMVSPAIALQQSAETLAAAAPAFATVSALESELRVDCEVPCATTDNACAPSGAITLDQVGFAHSSGGGGVAEVSLQIATGEIVGIAGPSGAGKTTLIDLLAGLIRPQTGSITIDEVPLSRDTTAAWRKRIAYLGQDAFLTSDTIRDNLAHDGVDEAAMWCALEAAQMADCVRAMPQGLDTPLTERGARLSGGERQRVAIARGLLRSPVLLLLDEATNAIDIATEHRIMLALSALRPAPTIIVVAHRSETLAHCTRIVQMAGGRVVADSGVPPAKEMTAVPRKRPARIRDMTI
jgi:ATP-binding cassette, subfamily C, bacterial